MLSSEVEQNVLAPDIAHHTWIGLHRDPKNRSRWLWVDGSTAMYTNWDYGEPNNKTATGIGSEDCGEIYPASMGNVRPGKWNDRICSDKRHYVCEISCKLEKIVERFMSKPYWLKRTSANNSNKEICCQGKNCCY